MEGVNDDIERSSPVARLDGNKPVWGVALCQGGRAASQPGATLMGRLDKLLTLQMRPQERFILTTRPLLLHLH